MEKKRTTRPRSESGASMSKYDVEVEARLQALEAKLDDLIKKLSKKMSF